MKREIALCLLFAMAVSLNIYAQHRHDSLPQQQLPANTEAQPLLAQALRLMEALRYLGSPLQKEDELKIQALSHQQPDSTIVLRIQQILDPYCLATVTINPEARVSVNRGSAPAVLVQGGWKSFLVKVSNEAGITAALEMRSPNAAPLLHGSQGGNLPAADNELTRGQLASRFLEVNVYRNRPLQPTLSGLGLEYAVVQLYTKEQGKREATISFNVGHGTEDLGFRNAIPVLFNCRPSVKVVLRIKDEKDQPVMASFIIKDGIQRILPDSIPDLLKIDYHHRFAVDEYNVYNKSLTGLYPLPSRRLALTDEYPDFFFQPQVYRSDGEHVNLPPGHYIVSYTRGPEYQLQTKEITVPEGVREMNVDFKLARWIDMAQQGWYSADHHVHAAGCSHYESPEEGVKPEDMVRQVKGEDLNVAAVLTWGPGWYHQKQFFTGALSPLSSKNSLMRYDVEVSGFPSSHAGHLVLLNLKEDDYPGTKTIEDWPTWTAPVLQWAKQQQGVTGYAHSGWGLQPSEETVQLPNNALPKMDGIGANEYIVTVTQHLVDIFSAGDTPAPWELNMWYHTLNCGFRTRLSGETDFPCIFDERVGIARSYFKASSLSYDGYMDALKNGRSYVSDGRAHLVDFSVNGTEMGTAKSEVQMTNPDIAHVKARAAAWLPETQGDDEKVIANRSLTRSPYWHIARARIGRERKVRVELIFNGLPVDTAALTADGNWQELSFDYRVTRSGWMALRIFPAAHTNPVFISVGGKPIREPASATWCRDALNQCWKMKQGSIRKEEYAAAKQAYDEARVVYEAMMKK